MRLFTSLAAALLGLVGLAACAAAEPEQKAGTPGQPPAWARLVVPLSGEQGDHDALIAAARPARFVLLGESTHGTHEYYRERARISDRLVRELGFGGIAIEGDWSATYRVNQYVRGLGKDRSAAEALGGYRNFPYWMWRNAEFRDFIDRLRTWNMGQPAERRAGVYGMDVYDLFDAADAVTAYLARVSPPAADRARRYYRCFAPYGRSTHAYGEASRRASRSCREAAGAVVAEFDRLPPVTGTEAQEQRFAASRAAASVAAAEEYFRTVYAGSMAWNVRDQHMARNLEAIAQHLERQGGRPGKLAVWSHNTHSGDARATFAANRGELNLGQLMRQRHGQDAFLVGFFSHEGTVLAAPEWDAPGRVYDMRPALAGSYAALFRQLGKPAFSLLIRGNEDAARLLKGPMLERAIGVVYVPQSERMSHYFDAGLSEQFDAAIYFDRSKAVTPLKR
jgi:erythromycin esterase-like protein